LSFTFQDIHTVLQTLSTVLHDGELTVLTVLVTMKLLKSVTQVWLPPLSLHL